MTQVRNDKPDDPETALVAGSPDRFGYEWHNYSELRPEHEEQFRGWTAHLKPEDWRGVTFLGGGCGMGRHAYGPRTYGAKGGLAIQLETRSATAATRTRACFASELVEKLRAYALVRVDHAYL